MSDTPMLYQWAFLVNLQSGRSICARVSKSAEVGDYEADMSRSGSDWVVAALFDHNVKRALRALTALNGNSIEGNQVIEDILAGTCRSFLEAQENLKKWRETPP